MILALDQGTTSSRAIIFDKEGAIRGLAQQEFRQIYPKEGWVEHEPMEIWNSQLAVARQALEDADIDASQIVGIGITNQRETTIVWERSTGKPIYPAIVWQDRRTAKLCEELKAEGWSNYVQERTGLLIDAYFSASKIHWILQHVPGAQQRAEAGELCFGTVDSWLLWQLTEGQVHATDPSNASRTMLFDIHRLDWDEKLLERLRIPRAMLPEVKSSSERYGHTELLGPKIPIAGIAGDQQAALFGQKCWQSGMAKNTYGTGCFMLMNTGQEAPKSQSKLLATIAWQIDGQVSYALEGSVFIAGAAIQWLRDELHILDSAADSEYFARKVPDNGGVYVVPAFAGLGAPHWDMYARGAILGLSRGSSKAHIIRATLESLAFQTRNVLQAMQEDTGLELEVLNVDGGASANNFLLQFQADILRVPVQRAQITETTALGAAYLAGLALGFWKKDELLKSLRIDRRFETEMPAEQAARLCRRWQKALERSMDWMDDDED